MTRIDTIMPDVHRQGWGPILALAQLTADLFSGRRLGLPDSALTRSDRLWSMRPRVRGRGDSVLMALLGSPSDLTRLRASPAFRQGYRSVIVWIIDSFWDNDPIRQIEYAGIDLVCITRPEEYDHYRRRLGDRVLVLNWGADVLNRGSGSADRTVDLQRMGRQPEAFDDDAVTARMAAEYGLSFAGRPPNATCPLENQRQLMDVYASTKYVLAHTNLASVQPNTHPVKEYITGRWTDALACGATVAGKQPASDHYFQHLLWKGATLDFDRIDLRNNIAALAEAVAVWTPEQARHNHLMALERLDWRHCLKQIAERMSVRSTALDHDLGRIAARAAQLRNAGHFARASAVEPTIIR